MNESNTELRSVYEPLLRSNITWYEKKEMLANNNTFYMLLVPDQLKEILKVNLVLKLSTIEISRFVV